MCLLCFCMCGGRTRFHARHKSAWYDVALASHHTHQLSLHHVFSRHNSGPHPAPKMLRAPPSAMDELLKIEAKHTHARTHTHTYTQTHTHTHTQLHAAIISGDVALPLTTISCCADTEHGHAWISLPHGQSHTKHRKGCPRVRRLGCGEEELVENAARGEAKGISKSSHG